MIDDHDIARLMENRSGVDGNLASHKSTAICWRYQKAKGITKKRAAPFWCCPFLYSVSVSKMNAGFSFPAHKLSCILFQPFNAKYADLYSEQPPLPQFGQYGE